MITKKNKKKETYQFSTTENYRRFFNDSLCFQKECEDTYKDRVSYNYLFGQCAVRFMCYLFSPPYKKKTTYFELHSHVTLSFITTLYSVVGFYRCYHNAPHTTATATLIFFLKRVVLIFIINFCSVDFFFFRSFLFVVFSWMHL